MTTGSSARRALRKSLIAAGAVLFALVAYVGHFYVSYQWPRQPLPPVDATVGERLGVEPALSGAAREAEERLLLAIEMASMPAVSAAVGLRGELVWAQALGFADVESSRPASLATKFRLGSTSKALTGVLLGRLVERGALDLDAPIGRLVSELPPHLAELTPRQLATHTSGVRHYRLDPWSYPPHESLRNERTATVSEALSIFRDDALAFPPGSDFLYSTYGYVLLSRALEASGRQEFPELMAREVFEPSGMTESEAEHQGETPMTGETGYYETDAGSYLRSFPVDNSFRWAGGGFVGTPGDLVRLGNAVLGATLLDVATKAELFEPQPLADGSDNPQHYALGWRSQISTGLLGEAEPVHVVHHGGIQAGGSCFFMILPERELAVAVMANSGAGRVRGEVQDVAFDLARLFLTAK